MTDQDDIKRLRKLLAKATPGTWSWESESRSSTATLYAGRDNQHHGANLLGRLEPDSNGANNLDLIVETINALPALLDELDELEERRASTFGKVLYALEQVTAERDALQARIEQLEADNAAQLKELQGWREDKMAVIVKPQGMTAYNLCQTDESAIRAKLTELGWTPPEDAALKGKSDE